MKDSIKQAIRRMLLRGGLRIYSVNKFGLDVESEVRRFLGGELRTIFDVGANTGQSALRFSGAFPTSDIYSFEPVPDTFAALKQNTSGIRHVRTFQCAMGAKPDRAKIFLGDVSQKNSMVAETGKSVDVEVKTIDGFCDENGIKAIDFLKIDVEGFEFQVLDGAAKMLDGHVKFIYCECALSHSDEEPHIELTKLQARLNPDFVAACFYPEAFSYGSCYGNALFMHRSLVPR